MRAHTAAEGETCIGITGGCICSSLQVNTSLSWRWSGISAFTCFTYTGSFQFVLFVLTQTSPSLPHFLYYLLATCILRVVWAVCVIKVEVYGRKQHGCIFPRCCCQTQDNYLDLLDRDCCRYEVLVQPDSNGRIWNYSTSSQRIDTVILVWHLIDF